MRYQGGKFRLAKPIAGIINDIIARRKLTRYVEPFCGMCSVGRRVTLKNRFFSDIHPDLILMLQALQGGWRPPCTLSEDEWRCLKTAEPSPLRAFAGFGCSWGGVWFCSYARKAGRHDHVGRSFRATERIGAELQGAVVKRLTYWESPEADITYCDPPYAGVSGYRGNSSFNHDRFWQWVRNRKGVTVVSELTAPDWMCTLWEKSYVFRAGGHGGSCPRVVEKLFVHWN